MKNLSARLKAAALAVALALTPLAAYAGGMFENFPLLSGASRCAGTSTGVSGTQCVSTIPAGPTNFEGTEYLPFDTGYSQGRAPQTATVPIYRLSAGKVQYEAPLTGASLTVASNVSTLVIDPAGTIATLTVTLPANSALVDGQTLEIGSSNTVTALTLTAGSGSSIAQNPTAITVSTTASYGIKLIYVKSATKWVRLQ